MMCRLDHWLGKVVFHPPIIWACQRLGWTQHAFYRYVWWLVALIWLAMAKTASWFAITVLIAFALGRTVSAGVMPDAPTNASLITRIAFLGLWAADVVATLLGAHLARSVAVDLMVLFAEYAATIVSIPPRKKRERTSGKTVSA